MFPLNPAKLSRPHCLTGSNLELFASSSIADLQQAVSDLAAKTDSSSSLQVAQLADLNVQTLSVQSAATFYGTITVKGEAISTEPTTVKTITPDSNLHSR